MSPHVQTVPSALSAVPPAPPLIATTPVRFLTWTGVVRETVVPSPSQPEVLSPQAQTVPSALSARLCSPLPATATTLARLETGTGTGLLMNVPLPSWPRLFSPQASGIPGGTAAARGG